MRLQSLTSFNQSISAPHNGSNAAPRVLLIAGSTLELPDSDWKPFEAAAAVLIANGNARYLEAPASRLTNKDITEAIYAKTGISMPEGMKKADLQETAAKLGVELVEPAPVKEVAASKRNTKETAASKKDSK